MDGPSAGCPATRPGHPRPSLWDLVMLGRKVKHPISRKLLLASCDLCPTQDSWGKVHTPNHNSPEPLPYSRPHNPCHHSPSALFIGPSAGSSSARFRRRPTCPDTSVAGSLPTPPVPRHRKSHSLGNKWVTEQPSLG